MTSPPVARKKRRRLRKRNETNTVETLREMTETSIMNHEREKKHALYLSILSVSLIWYPSAQQVVNTTTDDAYKRNILLGSPSPWRI